MSKLFCFRVLKHFVEEPFCVSESFRYRKTLWITGEYHDFLSKICCFTVPRNFVGELVCVSETSCYRKSIPITGGRERHDFASQFFCFTVPKNFVGEHFSVSLISDLEKFYASEVYVTIFCRNFLSHSAEKIRRGTLLCCVSENFW